MKTLNLTTAQGNLKKSNNEAPISPHQMATLQSLLLLLLSCFSRARLLATPWTAAHQAPPSTGFARQKYWSGLPLPSPRLLTLFSLLDSPFSFSESSASGVQLMLRAHSSMGWLPLKCSAAICGYCTDSCTSIPFSARGQSSSATIQTDHVPPPAQTLHWLPPHSESRLGA